MPKTPVWELSCSHNSDLDGHCLVHYISFSALHSPWNVGSVQRINEGITAFRRISAFFSL